MALELIYRAETPGWRLFYGSDWEARGVVVVFPKYLSYFLGIYGCYTSSFYFSFFLRSAAYNEKLVIGRDEGK
jgi:hypothetical protein